MRGSFHLKALAPAKVNLSLRVVGRRPDGYHLIESSVLPVSVFDTVSLSFRPAASCSVVDLSAERGLNRGARNLAVAAACRLLAATQSRGSVILSIDKQIPVGAGLGGGSSDAASVLFGLNRCIPSPLPVAELHALAGELGADVPFFLFGRPGIMRGVGDLIEPASGIACPEPMVIAFDGVELSTARVFREFDDSLTSAGNGSNEPVFPTHRGADEIEFGNDLEEAAFRLHPGVLALLQLLTKLGAHGVRMTGSGSAVFGFCDGAREAYHAVSVLRSKGHWAKVAWGLGATPAALGRWAVAKW